MMKFHNKYFVGIKGDLGFATPDGTDKAAEKRKDTVRGWASQYVYEYDSNGRGTRVKLESEFRTFDNVPIEGFNLGKSVSRWSTSNKWFRITDPRGFDLEISAENISEIVQTCDILKGEIQGKMVWMRDGSTNYLVHESHREYQNRNDEENNSYKVVQGVPFKFGDEERVYLGRFYVGMIGKTTRHNYNRDWKTTRYDVYTPKIDDIPVHVYVKKSIRWQDDEPYTAIDFRRSKIPNKKCVACDSTWLLDNEIDLTNGFHDATTPIDYDGGYHKRYTFSDTWSVVQERVDKVSDDKDREKLFND